MLLSRLCEVSSFSGGGSCLRMKMAEKYKITTSLNWSVMFDLTHLEPSNTKEQDKQVSPAAQSASDEQVSWSCCSNGNH